MCLVYHLIHVVHVAFRSQRVFHSNGIECADSTDVHSKLAAEPLPTHVVRGRDSYASNLDRLRKSNAGASA